MRAKEGFPLGDGCSAERHRRLPDRPRFLALWPSGEPRPDASSINFVDVVGYYSTEGHTYTPLTPGRAVDTRRGLGARQRKVAAGSVTRVACAGQHGVPRHAKAVLANIVSVAGSQQTFFTVFPAGSALNETSSLSAAAGAVVANTVVAKLGNDGKLDIFNHAGTTDLVVDIYGYFT